MSRMAPAITFPLNSISLKCQQNKQSYHQSSLPAPKQLPKMSIRTIQREGELQDLIAEHPAIIVAALEAGFPPGVMHFEMLAHENGQNNVVFAKFMLGDAPELEEHFEINSVASLFMFIGGQKVDQVEELDPSRWEELVNMAADMQ